jgi:hypothetical protein
MGLQPVEAATSAVGFAGTSVAPTTAPANTLLAGTQTAGAQKTTERPARESGVRPPRPSVPLPGQAAFGGGDAAGGGPGFFFFGAAALVALLVVGMPGMAWALVTRARPAAAQPFLSLLERPG